MSTKIAGLRFPYERALLPRTKLAYVNLRNLLTDAKRDRSARVFGYVRVLLPEELILLYLQAGELVNATSFDGKQHAALPVAEALGRVPAEPEYGEIAFNECDDEQLACMYFSQVTPPEPWPEEIDSRDPTAIFPYLMATTYDGVLEICVHGDVNYLIFRDGTVQRAFLHQNGRGTLVERVQQLFQAEPPRGEGRHEVRGDPLTVRRWPVPPPLPIQAAPPLVQAYRELVHNLVARLVAAGKESAPVVAELARETLVPKHAALKCYSALDRPLRDPVVDTEALTSAIAAWISELLWATADLDSAGPESLLKELTKERRHMFQSAGLFDRLPWQLNQ